MVKSVKTEPPATFLSGRFHFEDQFRQVLVKRGTKLIHLVYLDDFRVSCMTAPISELRYLNEEGLDLIDNKPLLKRRARQFLKKSPLVGAKREMTKKAKGVLQEILDL